MFITAAITAWQASNATAAVYSVSTSAALQAGLDKAVAGDEIVLADGSYSGQFYIRNNAGTSANPIVVRAANKHKAIMQGNNVCDRYQEGFVIQRSHWLIKDLKFKDHGRAISIYASNVEIAHNIIDHFREEGIRVEGTTGARIHDNVIAFGDGCAGDGPGIYLVNNADNNSVTNNIMYATGDNGYTYGSKNGHGMLIANNSDDNLVQGNLLFANGGKGTFRILGGKTVSSVSRNLIRDNTLLWGEGEQSSGDCVDDSNQFVNNLFYSTYQAVWSTKGNFDGTKGNTIIRHNLFYTDAFSRIGASLGNGGEPYCDNPIVNYKVNNIVQDNIFFSPDRQSDWHRTWLVSGDGNVLYPAIKQASNNLFWAPGTNPLDWVIGYTFRSTDIRDPQKQPLFTNPAEGDFSLAPASPGKGAASDGKDVGLEYNIYLKKSWLKNAFTLPTQKKEGLNTSASFSVDPAKYYQVWFYIPVTSCKCIESFNIEGQLLTRDSHGLTSDPLWVQPGGPARWITLGRHRASDGSLNISWSNSASAEKIFIRELPTAEETSRWISGVGSAELAAPTGLTIVR